MKIPTIIEAEKLLNEAKQHNPGAWISHSKTAAFCAKTIAERCDNLDAETAYVFGLLHDIGRREGVTDMRHIIDGYHFMASLGYDDCARVCLTHYSRIRIFAPITGKTIVQQGKQNLSRVFLITRNMMNTIS